MYDEIIHNPVTGETLRVLESNQDVFRVEFTIKPGGEIAAEHLHPYQQQTIFVLEGELGCSIAKTNYTIKAGGAKIIPAGAPHFQWNAQDRPTRAVEQFRPAGRVHEMFRVAFALARDGHTDSKGVPKPLIGAAFVSEFKGTVRPTSTKLRLVFGILGPISWLLGYRRTIREYIERFSRDEVQRARLMTLKEISEATHPTGEHGI